MIHHLILDGVIPETKHSINLSSYLKKLWVTFILLYLFYHSRSFERDHMNSLDYLQ
jgi:hypothetical protein